MIATSIQPFASSTSEPTLPQVPGYTVMQLLGSGGMGEVFLGRQNSLDRLVAIKLLRRGSDPTWSGSAPRALSGPLSDESRMRFQREARLMAQVSHPHIVTIFDCGQFEDRDYLVFEYVEGSQLRSLLEPGVPLETYRALALLEELAAAVNCLHTQGILHRDLKPENVLLTADGKLKVTDFGIAVPLVEMGDMTAAHQCLGTLDYMAPEQRARLPLDERADQFSLAAVTYEMLTGRRPLGRFPLPSAVNTSLPSPSGCDHQPCSGIGS